MVLTNAFVNLSSDNVPPLSKAKFLTDIFFISCTGLWANCFLVCPSEHSTTLHQGPVHTCTNCFLVFVPQNIVLPYIKDLYTLKKKNSGPLSQQEMDNMRPMDKLKLIQRIITEHAPSCMDTRIIPSQRCPILRFTDYNSQIKCDLSINNK